VADGSTIQDFEALVGSSFRVASNELPSLSLETVVALGAPMISGGREPFSLTFRGPVTPVFPQATYRLLSEAAGPFEIFLVPISTDDRGVAYEAIFA
jgi:hypothetical protein